MKRIISYFLVITILVTCMIPAFTINAADGAKISATDATPVFGDTSFESEITIADNPGIAALEIVVFFKTADISSVDVDFTGTVYDPENCGIGSVIAGTNNKVKSLISGLGLTPADYKAVIVDLTTTEGDNTDANGKLFTAMFTASGDAAVGTDLSYGIAVKTAQNVDGDDVAVDESGKVCVATVQADPYLGTYEDFSLFAAGPAEVELGTETVDVQIRIDGNVTGIWTFRAIVAYDPAWAVDFDPAAGTGSGIKNGNMFPDDSEMTFNIQSAEAYPASEAFEYFGKTADVAGQNAIVAVSVPNDESEGGNCTKEGGIFYTVTFKVPEGAKVGDKLELKLAYCEGDQAVVDESRNPPIYCIEPVDVYDYTCTIVDAVCEHPTTHENIIPATCTEDGAKQQVCDVCGAVVSSETIPTDGHQWVKGETVDPTCKDDGYTVYECSVCHITENRNVVPATGLHEYVEGTPVPATCAEDGYTPYTCKFCGTVDKRDIVSKDTVPHTPGEPVVVEPTCTENGSSTVYCTICDAVISTETILTDGHNWVAGETHAPTCTERGWTDYECSVCHETKQDDFVDAKGHDWAEATCTAPKTCNTCGATEGDALGHQAAAPVVVTPPTCTEAGHTTVNCSRCGALLDESYPDALGHKEFVEINTQPTYDADGRLKIVCERCQEVLQDTVRPRLTVGASVVCVIENDDPDADDIIIAQFDYDGLYKGEVFQPDIPEIPGYTIVEGTEQIEIELGEDGNYILYAYTANTDITYTVKYVDENGKELADAKVVTGQTMASEVTEKAIEIKGYTVDEAEKTIVLEAEGNEIVFTYKADKTEGGASTPDDTKKPTNSQTGDNMIFIIIALAVAAVGAVAVVIVRSRRKEH